MLLINKITQSTNQKKTFLEIPHHATKGQAGYAQPNPSSKMDRQLSPISSGSGGHTAGPCSGAAMERWQRETPQEQYWNSEGYYTKK